MLKKLRKEKLCSVLVAAFLSLGVAHSAASLTLSQSPLFLRTGADPNVMFILDDSGSMQFEVTPSEVSEVFGGGFTYRGVLYVYPNSSVSADNASSQGVSFTACPYDGDSTSNCDYWGKYYGNLIPAFDANNKWAAYFRSSHNNASYYNPAVRYRPWVDEDGNSLGNASPTKAYHNPKNTSKGWRDLTVNNTQSACWIKDSASASTETGGWEEGWHLCEGDDKSKSLSFYPATYFRYKGVGEVKLASSYERVEIKPGAGYTGGAARTDCANPSACTYAEEIQNFANWYSYYRSRVLTARAGVGRAFAAQPEDLRVGFGTINKGSSSVDSVNTSTIVNGVRSFSGTDREAFFTNLYERDIPTAGTPLLSALDDAGKYYSRTDNNGPWGKIPGNSDASAQLACRASYTILMTDGYGSDYGSYNNNTAIGNSDGAKGAPFSDGNSNTLGDIAMHYWNNDLHGDLDNKVQTTELDPANWQHMVTFGVGLGVQGSVDADNAFAAIKTGASVSWPNPRTNGDSAKLDDLLHAGVNSRGGFFSAKDSETFASELSKVLEDIADRQTGSASSVAANSTRLGTDTVIYQALFNSGDWSGEIKAIPLKADGSLGSTVAWSTSDVGKIPSADSRNILTYNGSSTVAFQWTNLTATQKSALIGSDDATVGEQRLNWIRGQAVDDMRSRTTLLGDVVNASPVYAGRKNYRFDRLPDALGGGLTSVGGVSVELYTHYYDTSKKNRTEVLYVSANDGMVHAFKAGGVDGGRELFAYVPSGAYSKLKNLTLPNYGTSENPHQYLVDGPLFVGDAYFDKDGNGTSEWVNVLVGTYGAGAKGLFALDVTDPASPSVLLELDGSNADIGNIMGQPILAPTASGWKIIAGNGYNSTNGDANLIVVDLASRSVTAVEADDAIDNNGLAGPSLLTDGEGVVTAAYAGDLFGNMWKFSLGNNWGVPYKSKGINVPLFKAQDAGGNVQPITAAPTLGINAQMDGSIMVYFGTGSYISSTDNGAGSVVNSFYAIADTGERVTLTDSDSDGTLDRNSQLMQKTIVENGDTRTVTNNASTTWWSGDSQKRGWYMDLTPDGSVTGERMISKPLLQYDRLIFPTLITSDDPCSYGASGWRMELVAVGDKYESHSIFGVAGQREDYAVISYSEFIRGGEKAYVPYTNTQGGGGSHPGMLPSDSVGRMSWRQLR